MPNAWPILCLSVRLVADQRAREAPAVEQVEEGEHTPVIATRP